MVTCHLDTTVKPEQNGISYVLIARRLTTEKQFQKTQEAGYDLGVLLEVAEAPSTLTFPRLTQFLPSDSVVWKLHSQGHAEPAQNPGPRVS